jgi:hypothetical protein
MIQLLLAAMLFGSSMAAQIAPVGAVQTAGGGNGAIVSTSGTTTAGATLLAACVGGYSASACGFTLTDTIGGVPTSNKWRCNGNLAGGTQDAALWYAYDSGVTLRTWGDSITYGMLASVAAKKYANLVTAAQGWTLIDSGVSGNMVADFGSPIYAVAVKPYDRYSYMIGTNDGRHNGVSAPLQALYKSGLAAQMAWLAIPDENKLYGISGAVTYTGAWTATPTGWTLGKYTQAAGATAAFSVTGTTIYIGTIVIDTTFGLSSSWTVTVDGVNQGSFTSVTSETLTTFNATPHNIPGLIRIAGLSAGTHAVVVTQTSGIVYFDWAAGNANAATSTGPFLWQSSIIRQSTSGYGTFGSSDTIVAAYNVDVADNVAKLLADGLHVYLWDSWAAVNNTTDLADGLHPNDAGHAKIAAALEAEIAVSGSGNTGLPGRLRKNDMAG